MAWRSYLDRALGQSFALVRQQNSGRGGEEVEAEGGQERLFEQALIHCKHDVIYSFEKTYCTTHRSKKQNYLISHDIDIPRTVDLIPLFNTSI